MEIYLIIVIVLFALAASDLIVGVSNDAVNFLNSAVGSKVAPRYIIMIIASIGILVGTTFSSGMMEVARKGIFNPDMFLLQEVMVIFLAVMLTDVILLDLYNTFGLPTSTTVSLIFELLGASVAVSLLKISAAGGNAGELMNYINSGKALAIISGILISVVVAFSAGALIQFFIRMTFTFDFEKRIRRYGAIWGSIAFSFITYYILVKGAKGSALMSADIADWVKDSTGTIIFGSLLIWAVIFQFLIWFTKINILKPIVLVGTFALALAFAANDLVNFIGVPLAGLSSYQIALNTTDPLNTIMSALNEPVNTPTFFLLIAGIIMVLTLWTSKKAQTVTKTEVSLGRQQEGFERFESSALSRTIVRMGMSINLFYQKIVPQGVRNKIQQRFDNSEQVKFLRKQKDAPSFDLLRASVNLMVSAVLISFATSLKLPLSTTYVTFMVAMGTSLADKSWGRDSAVYRINGVLTVISGWFFTAFMAFTVAGIFATIIFFGELFAIIGLIAVAIFFVFRTHIIHKNRAKEEAESEKAHEVKEITTLGERASEVVSQISSYLLTIDEVFNKTIDGLSAEDRLKAAETRKLSKKLKKQANVIVADIFNTVKVITKDDFKEGKRYGKIISSVQEISRSLRSIAQNNFDHLDNVHIPPSEEENQLLERLKLGLSDYIKYTAEQLSSKSFKTPEETIAKLKWFEDIHNSFEEGIVERVKFEKTAPRNSLLYLGISADSENIAKHLNTLLNQVRSAYGDLSKTKTQLEELGS